MVEEAEPLSSRELAVDDAQQGQHWVAHVLERRQDVRAGLEPEAIREVLVVEDSDTTGQLPAAGLQIVPEGELLLGGHEEVDHAASSIAGASTWTPRPAPLRRSERERIVAALMSPVTFSTVLKMSGIASTASRMTTPSSGIPAAR